MLRFCCLGKAAHTHAECCRELSDILLLWPRGAHLHLHGQMFYSPPYLTCSSSLNAQTAIPRSSQQAGFTKQPLDSLSKLLLVLRRRNLKTFAVTSVGFLRYLNKTLNCQNPYKRLHNVLLIPRGWHPVEWPIAIWFLPLSSSLLLFPIL